MGVIGLIGGIIIIILGIVLIVMGILGITKGKAFNKKINSLPDDVRPKAAKIYGIGSIISGLGAFLLALNLMQDYVGLNISNWPGVIVLLAGILIETAAQRTEKK